ncbi:MAG: 5-oxoprolinase subunit PxpB [Acetivibrionales bacterium]
MQANIEGYIESVPSYRALLVFYDVRVTNYRRITRQVRKILKRLSAETEYKSRTFRIPVCYGGKYGPDLDAVAAHAGISKEEVIVRHTAPKYLIYMLGFLPGFAYLGGLDPSLEMPRVSNPRSSIMPGSVGIGGKQTGIYPIASPSGWQLIGCTPLRLYDPRLSDPILYRPGDYIQFYEISETRFQEIEEQVNNGTYKCEIV